MNRPRNEAEKASGIEIRCPSCDAPKGVRDLDRDGRASCPCGKTIDLRLSKRRPDRHQIEIFTKGSSDCPLCEEALDEIESIGRTLQADVDLVVRTIESDSVLEEAFREHVPVVFVNGKFRFRGRILPHILRGILEHPPATS